MNACKSPSLTAIVKPTYECNLGCLYCYEGDHPKMQLRMDEATLRNVITKLAEYHGTERPARIIWHGGEPLLMGTDFFRTAIQIQQEIGPDYRFDNSIQTNGTLLTDEMLDFCDEHEFSIGMSLDGPQWLHDFTRPYADGRSSFLDVMTALDRMRQRNVDSSNCRRGGVIAILTKPVLAHLDEFYEFFRDKEIHVKINPIFYSGRGSTVREKLGITPTEFGEAMTYLFNRWFNESEYTIEIDPFDLVLGNLMTGEPWGCQFGPACYDEFISIDPDGDVYPCGRWNNKDLFKMGNLKENSIEGIRRSPVLVRFRQARMEAMSSCKFCEFASICNAGCVENAYLIRQRLSDRDMYCAGYKQMFTHLRQALLAALDESSMQSCVSTGTEIVTILGREINVETVQNPALRRVIEQRICNTTISPMNWGEHKKWSEYYPDYKKHDKYSEYKKYEKYNEHSRTYNEHWKERWKEHKKYSDHYDHWQTPY